MLSDLKLKYLLLSHPFKWLTKRYVRSNQNTTISCHNIILVYFIFFVFGSFKYFFYSCRIIIKKRRNCWLIKKNFLNFLKIENTIFFTKLWFKLLYMKYLFYSIRLHHLLEKIIHLQYKEKTSISRYLDIICITTDIIWKFKSNNILVLIWVLVLR